MPFKILGDVKTVPATPQASVPVWDKQKVQYSFLTMPLRLHLLSFGTVKIADSDQLCTIHLLVKLLFTIPLHAL